MIKVTLRLRLRCILQLQLRLRLRLRLHLRLHLRLRLGLPYRPGATTDSVRKRSRYLYYRRIYVEILCKCDITAEQVKCLHLSYHKTGAVIQRDKTRCSAPYKALLLSINFRLSGEDSWLCDRIRNCADRYHVGRETSNLFVLIEVTKTRIHLNINLAFSC